MTTRTWSDFSDAELDGVIETLRQHDEMLARRLAKIDGNPWYAREVQDIRRRLALSAEDLADVHDEINIRRQEG